MELLNVPMTPSGVGGGMPTRWIYSEYGRMLNVYGIRSGINITFNTASADDIKNKLSQLYAMRDVGKVSNLDIQELEERLRLMSNINIYGNGQDQSMVGVSELPVDIEPEKKISEATEAQLEALEKAREASQTEEAKAKRRKTIAAKQEAKILGLNESVDDDDDSDLDDILGELEFDTVYVANDDIVVGDISIEEDEFIEIVGVDFDSEELEFIVYTVDGEDRAEGVVSFTELEILIDNGDIEDAEEFDDEVSEKVHIRHGKAVKFSASKERVRSKLASRKVKGQPNRYKLDRNGHIVRKSAEELRNDKIKSRTFGKRMKKYRRKRNKSAKKSRKINRGR